MTKVVELYAMGFRHKNRLDRRVMQSVALVLPDEGYGPCYLVLIERYADTTESVIPIEQALPQVANAYIALEAVIGKSEAWLRTLKE